MKNLIVWVLVFQFSLSSWASAMGEKKEFEPTNYIITSLSEVRAEQFAKVVEQEIEKLSTLSLGNYLTTKTDIDQTVISSLINQMGSSSRKNVHLNQKSPGYWEYSQDGHKINFTLTDLYKEQIVFNGKIFSFKGKKLDQVYKELMKENGYKTSYFDLLISPAYAIAPVIIYIIAIAVAAIVAGQFAKSYLGKQERALAALNEMKNRFRQDNQACENDNYSGSFLNEYFSSANTSVTRITNRSLSMQERALRKEMMKQMEASQRGSFNCVESTRTAFEETGVSMPQISQNQIDLYSPNDEITPGGGSSARLRDALLGMCDGFNNLMRCVDNQVNHFVNNQSQNYKLESGIRDVVETRRSSGALQR